MLKEKNQMMDTHTLVPKCGSATGPSIETLNAVGCLDPNYSTSPMNGSDKALSQEKPASPTQPSLKPPRGLWLDDEGDADCRTSSFIVIPTIAFPHHTIAESILRVILVVAASTFRLWILNSLWTLFPIWQPPLPQPPTWATSPFLHLLLWKAFPSPPYNREKLHSQPLLWRLLDLAYLVIYTTLSAHLSLHGTMYAESRVQAVKEVGVLCESYGLNKLRRPPGLLSIG